MNLETRYFFYDLFFSMFVREPSDDIIEAWRVGFDALAESWPDAPLTQAAQPLIETLASDDVNEKVRSEFLDLFWSPTGPIVSVLGSLSVDGKPFGEYLIRLRGFIEKTPFRKREEYIDPEDSLPFHLDLMRLMIQEEDKSECPQEKDDWRKLQHELALDFIRPWIDKPLEKLAARVETEPIYSQIATLLRQFMREECENLQEERNNAPASQRA